MLVPHLASEKMLSVSGLLWMEVNTLQSDLKCYEAVLQFGLLGPEDSGSFTKDCKPQPSKDLNIKLQDELQCCPASN